MQSDRKLAAFACDHRRVGEKTGNCRNVERRRHDEDAELGPHESLGLQRERETEVGVQAALVEFVEDEEIDALERWIVLEHAGEDTLGYDLESRRRPDARVESHAITNGGADCLT